MSDDLIHQAVGAIYDAAVDEARWDAALDLVT